MNCPINRDGLIESYLLGRLGEKERDGFEQHYFECEACFERLQMLRALRHELDRGREALGVPAPVRRRDQGPRSWAWTTSLAAALAAAVGISVIWSMARPTPPTGESKVPTRVEPQPPVPPAQATPELAALGRFEPPEFAPPRLRGVSSEATRRFHAAMSRYSGGDFAGALAELESASRMAPEAPGPRFFLGICLLLESRIEEGTERLRETVALGDTPYLEEARFYLAKGLLLGGDQAAAEAELEETIALEGDLEDEARELLDRLRTIP
jgi:hypothetical protein